MKEEKEGGNPDLIFDRKRTSEVIAWRISFSPDCEVIRLKEEIMKEHSGSNPTNPPKVSKEA